MPYFDPSRPMPEDAPVMRMEAMRGFYPLAVMQAIERHRVTHMFLPPTAVYMLLAEPTVRTADLSSLEYISYAGAPMSVPAASTRRFWSKGTVTRSTASPVPSRSASFHSRPATAPSAALSSSVIV